MELMTTYYHAENIALTLKKSSELSKILAVTEFPEECKSYAGEVISSVLKRLRAKTEAEREETSLALRALKVQAMPDYIAWYEEGYQFARTSEEVTAERVEKGLRAGMEYRRSNNYWAEMKNGEVVTRYRLKDGEVVPYKKYNLVTFQDIKL